MSIVKSCTLLAIVVMFFTACSPPVLDTSSVPAFIESTQRITESLDEEQAPVFEDAFDFLTDDAEVTADPKYLEPVIVDCARLSGMTAVQIVSEAWLTRIRIAKERIADLESRREASAKSRKTLDRVTILEATLFRAEPGFLDTAVVDVELENHTKNSLFKVSFKTTLRHQDELDPWVVEIIERPFGSGLKPGKKAKVRLELKDGEWRRFAEAGSKGVFTCEVVRIEGRRKRLLAKSDFVNVDEVLLEAMYARLDELRSNQPVL